MKIAFIGGGNMATAMIMGILKQGSHEPENICVADRDLAKLESLKKHRIRITNNNQHAVNFADFVFLTIKPQVYKEVISPLVDTKGKIFVTVAPGIPISFVESLCEAKVIRTMPNTPAMVGNGVTAVARSSNITANELDTVKNLLSSFSWLYEIEEKQMDSAVALSGSSPAYAYLFIDAIATASSNAGIDYATAIKAAAHSVLGAAQMILQTGETPTALCEKVCSKGGTTIKAIEMLNASGFANIVAKAMKACTVRAKELSETF